MREIESKRRLRLLPLAAGLALAGFVVGAQAAAFSAAMPVGWKAGDRSGVTALFAKLDARSRARPAQPAHVVATLSVTSCADDGSAGTLRSVVTGAGEGDTVDASALTCAIALTQGAIPVYVDDLTVVGAGAKAFAIDGAGVDRVFLHYGYGTLDLQNLTVRNGVARVSGYHVTGGACIVSNGYVRLDQSTVSGCLAEGEGVYGGGILARGVNLYSSTLSGNIARGSHPNTFTAAYGGGAMAYFGTATLYRSTVSGNFATHTASDTHGSYCTGGGIFSDLGGYAYGSTLSGNYSYGTGGGLAAHGPFDIAQSTLAGNTARFKTGGGMFVRTLDPMLVTNSTIAANDSGAPGAGIYFVGVTDALTIVSSIAAKNFAAGANGDIAAMSPLVIAGANDLVMSASANVILPVDTLGADPMLAPLANNGGPTRTLGLLAGSPALDTGSNPNGYAYDQRGPGFPRVLGAAADIGAFEGTVAPAIPPEPAPVLSVWFAGLLAALLAACGWCALRARAASAIFAN